MIAFGLRLAVRGGKEAAARLALTAVAVALGVGMLLAILAATNAVETQNGRYAWLTSAIEAPPEPGLPELGSELPVSESPGSEVVDDADAGVDPVWWLARADNFDGDQIIRVDVAATGPTAPVPPGIDELPGPGEYYASPAMSDLLQTASVETLADRFDASEVGTIGTEALPAPDSLVIVVGQTVDALSQSPHARPVTSIATAVPDRCSGCHVAGVIPDDGITVILAVAAVALLFPILIFIGSATRLSAARREQRFAAMRLIGATPRQISTIATVESTVAAVIGVVAGFALFVAIRSLIAEIPFTGARFFLGDLALGTREIVLVAVGVPLAAAIAARLALHRVQMSPLGVTRRTTPSAPRAWRLIPLLAGLGDLGFWYTVGRPDSTNAQILAYMSGILLTMIGLLVAGPWLTMVGARLIARRARTPSSLIAARRLADDPKAGFRSVSGLVLALFVTTVATGTIGTLVANRGSDGNPAAGDTLTLRFMAADPANLPTLPTDLPPELLAIPGVEGAATVHVDPAAAPSSPRGPGPRQLAVSCRELAGVPMLGNCPDSAGAALVMPYHGSEKSDLDTQEDTTWPAASYSQAELDELPVDEMYVATDGSTEAIELARTALMLAFPGHEFTPTTLAEQFAADDRQLEQWQQLANVVIFTTLPIAGCSLAVSVAAGLNARRRPFSLLRLAGTPLRSLQRVVGLEGVMPLILGTAVSMIAGFLTAHLFLRTQLDYSLHPPGVGYIALTLAGLLASMIVVASTLPILSRVSGPEVARND